MEFLFFFQAEDGIRDSSVTGVQTCALPIVAEQQQVIANRKAAKKGDSAAQQGSAATAQAQSSADQPTASANRATADAQTANAVGAADAAAVSMLNKRVSELDDYKNEFEVDVFFARDSALLNEKAKKDLDN